MPAVKTSLKSIVIRFDGLYHLGEVHWPRPELSSLPNRRPSNRLIKTMPGSSKVADILHKTVTGSLVLVTAFTLADVTRGFSVLVKRNMDRRAAHEAAVEQEPSDAGHKD
jgi:hypothetical protein